MTRKFHINMEFNYQFADNVQEAVEKIRKTLFVHLGINDEDLKKINIEIGEKW